MGSAGLHSVAHANAMLLHSRPDDNEHANLQAGYVNPKVCGT